MTRAFIFPGQGSQAAGMGKELADHSAAARQVFQQVDDALGENLSNLMFEGPEDQLTLTQNAQPALMAMSMAVLRALEVAGGFSLKDQCNFVAGHSLGEYSALCAAGALDVGDAARLLRQRGEAMQRAVPVGKGAMAALLGLDFETAKGVADDAAAGDVCATANDNAPGQVVVSGDKAAVERAVKLAKERGARRPMLLPVSAPFHCLLMQPAAEAMTIALAEVGINSPSVPVVTNVTASPTSDPAEIRDLLVRQVTAMVRWREGILKMKALGVDQLVELGAGKVLATMTKRIDKEITATSISTPADIQTFLATL